MTSTLTVDPTNPSIVYLGGSEATTLTDTGLIRIDTTTHLGCPLPGRLLQLRQ